VRTVVSVIRQFVLPAVFLSVGASSVLAQTANPAPVSAGSPETIEEIRKNSRIHAGPFYISPTVLLKELGVDTNVFNQAGAEKSDFTFTISPQGDIALPMARRALLRTSVAVDTVYYAKYASERSLDPQFTMRGEIYARRLTFFADDVYLNTRQRPNYEIDLRSRHLQNDASVGVSYRLTPKLSVEVAGHRGRVRFDGDAFFLGQRLQDTLNRDTTGYSVTVRHRLTYLSTIAARYENLRDEFPLSPIRNTDSYRIMPGVEFKPRALISGSAYVGYRNFHPRSGLLPDYSGLVSQLALSYKLLGSTIFGATYDRDVSYSYEGVTPYYVDNSPGVFIRRTLGGRYDVIVNAARHRYNYRHIVTAESTTSTSGPRIDTTDNYGANVGYRLKGRARIGAGASYWTRNSTLVASQRSHGLRAGTTVSYGF
jgi:hypothetical protein